MLQFLDELLFLFHTESLVAKEVTITDLDRDSWRIKCTLRGERFKQGHHEVSMACAS